MSMLIRFLFQSRHKESLWLILSLALFFTVSIVHAAETIHHQLHIKLQPDDSSISIIDNIQLPVGSDSTEFSLRNTLTVKAIGAELKLLGKSSSGRLHHYRISRLAEDGKVQLHYHGKIVSEKTVGPFEMPESALDKDNLYLDSGSAWLPIFSSFPLFTFNMQVDAPKNWQIISQGKRIDAATGYTFDMPHPQDDIYLIGGPYKRYAKDYDGIEVLVYLHEADDELAEKYLQSSVHYIGLYNDWIGRYPYAKFAVVENRWQTGYGMPSFTLLGSRVIRLPFILNTSLPHEILHNWWGNAVYIDYSNGNWSEGLTAYMSDHYNSEQQGKGYEYRRKALERYANFAAEQGDFALSDFNSRHDEASQAVGYSKALMLMHMLREQSGKDAFDENIRQFWQRYQFKYASFDDLIESLYNNTKSDNVIDYQHFIEQWLSRTGAPEIRLDDVIVEKLDSGYSLSIKVSQRQQGPAYELQLPIEVRLQQDNSSQRKIIRLTSKDDLITLKFKRQPQSLNLDPDFDVFRLLADDERPASLGRLFGAKKQLLVIPAKASKAQIQAWRELAESWSARYKNVTIAFDNQIKSIPEDVSLWLLGWNNALLKERQHHFTVRHSNASTKTFSQALSDTKISIDTRDLSADKYAVVLLDADNSRIAQGFIGAQDPEVIASIASKLPHYSSYGQLVFELPEVNNVIKQRLPVLNSPMNWSSDK